MSKFYIGQKIVAIKDHSQGVFKKGDEFTVFNIVKCCEYLVDIGLKNGIGSYCSYCNKDISQNILFFNESRFAPIELSTTTFEDVIKQYETCLN